MRVLGSEYARKKKQNQGFEWQGKQRKSDVAYGASNITRYCAKKVAELARKQAVAYTILIGFLQSEERVPTISG